MNYKRLCDYIRRREQQLSKNDLKRQQKDE